MSSAFVRKRLKNLQVYEKPVVVSILSVCSQTKAMKAKS